MPSVSEKQQHFFGIVRGIQEGKTPAGYSPAAAKVARQVTPKQAREFAVSPKALLKTK